MEKKQSDNKLEKKDDWSKRNKSHKTMFSYALGSFAVELIGSAFGGLYFKFYEDELLLGPIFILVANILFAIWNAVNDPLIGYISEKKRPFWKKFGKRGLFLAIAIPPLYIAYTLVFNVPKIFWKTGLADPAWYLDYIMFAWLFIMLCMGDTFYSLFFVHWMGQFPEKFPTDKIKSKANVWRLYLAITAVVVGTLLPAQIYRYRDPGSYGTMAVIIGLIAIIPSIGVIYGTRESPHRISLELEEVEEEKPDFWHYLKLGFKTKSYIAYLCFYFGNKIWGQFVIGTFDYYNQYVLGKQADDKTLLLALFIVGQIISVPVWTIISKKIGFRKTMIYAGFGQAIMTAPFIFITDYNLSIPFFLIVGFGSGGMWTMLAPVFSEVLDELMTKTGRRDSGIFVGINTFFGRFSIILFSGITAIIHFTTGYVAGGLPDGTQPPSAQLGIRILMSVIPVIGLTIAIILFAYFYDIKGDKKIMIEQKKIELGL